jgi:DeoR family fructose operon transcriptional repressor
MEDNKNLYAEERKEKIIRYLEEHKKISVIELCEYFGVSPTTIRNDLKELDEMNLIKRTHGGALYNNKTHFEPKYKEKSVQYPAIKDAIAQIAAEFIEDGDTIALDTGTTTLAIAKIAAKKNNLTIITNDIRIASYLEENSTNNSIILAGGTLRNGYNCTVGPATQNFLKSHFVDKAFIACDGFSIKAGITTPNIEQAELKRILIDIASEKVVVCDSSKLEREAFVQVYGLDRIDALITDMGKGPEIIEKFKSTGINVFIAGPAN